MLSFIILLVLVAPFTVSGKVAPFLEPGFFFDYNVPGQPVPLLVSQQCEVLHLKWARAQAVGPNPVAPYSLQIYTSKHIVPFLVDAGDQLEFDWAVPFAPNTIYQICMFDSNGVPGGCQDKYTVIPNTNLTESLDCSNVTVPDTLLDITGTVASGPLSQNGFIDQCTDVSIKPNNGKPPFTLTIAPPLHPPFNLTSNTMDPIIWTVSLSRAMPFFMSMVSSDGLVWANGPMHSGGFGPTDCLAPGTINAGKARSNATSAGVGGFFGGLILAGVLASLAFVFWRRRHRDPPAEEDKEEDGLPTLEIGTPIGLGRSDSTRSQVQAQQPVFVVHRDAVAVYEEEVVDLPPTYVRRDTPTESVQEGIRRYLPATPAPVQRPGRDTMNGWKAS